MTVVYRPPDAPPTDSAAEAAMLSLLLVCPELVEQIDLGPLLWCPEHEAIWPSGGWLSDANSTTTCAVVSPWRRTTWLLMAAGSGAVRAGGTGTYSRTPRCRIATTLNRGSRGSSKRPRRGGSSAQRNTSLNERGMRQGGHSALLTRSPFLKARLPRSDPNRVRLPSGRGMPRIEYEIQGDTLVRCQRAAGHELLFRAAHIRQERSGVHARIELTCDGAVLAWSNFNVERDEDRVRLSNSAYSHFQHRNGTGKIAGLPGYPKEYLKNDLDMFCAGLWDAQVAQTMPVEMAGTLEPAPPGFVLYPFVLSEGGTIIFAPPGRGKSYTLLLMAVSIDAGLEWMWRPVRKCKALFINLERGARSVADRLGNVNATLGLPRRRPLAMMNARGRSLTDVAAAAERYIGEHDVGVVFVDSISRAGAGDLNANESVNRIIDQLNRMCPAWVGLAHTPRADETHLYGGIHFEAGADAVVQLLSEQDEDGPLGIGLQITKQNDIGKVPLWTMALEFNDVGLAKVRRARPGEFPEVEAGTKLTMREAIREHILDVGARSATQIEEELGFNRANVADLFRKDRRHFQEVGRQGRQVLYGIPQLLPE
jgi:AAA domain